MSQGTEAEGDDTTTDDDTEQGLRERLTQPYHRVRHFLASSPVEHFSRRNASTLDEPVEEHETDRTGSLLSSLTDRFNEYSRDPNYEIKDRIAIDPFLAALQEADHALKNEPLGAWDPTLGGRPDEDDVEKTDGPGAASSIETYDDTIEFIGNDRSDPVHFKARYGDGRLHFEATVQGIYRTSESHDGKVIRSTFNATYDPVLFNDEAVEAIETLLNGDKLPNEQIYSGELTDTYRISLLDDTERLQTETTATAGHAKKHNLLDGDQLDDLDTYPDVDISGEPRLTIDYRDGDLVYRMHDQGGTTSKTLVGRLAEDISRDDVDDYLQDLLT
jgi:hypothetical protein